MSSTLSFVFDGRLIFGANRPQPSENLFLARASAESGAGGRLGWSSSASGATEEERRRRASSSESSSELDPASVVLPSSSDVTDDPPTCQGHLRFSGGGFGLDCVRSVGFDLGFGALGTRFAWSQLT